MGEPSGKFVLRVPKEFHARLKEAAFRSESSLNQICLELLQTGLRYRGEQPSVNAPIPRPLWNAILKRWHQDLEAIIVFGSVARGESSANSDVDLLLVLRPHAPVTRKLYREWDEICERLELKNRSTFSPQFVSRPKDLNAITGLWFEVALDGKVIWEKEGTVSLVLQKIRQLIAGGRVRRRMSHGHPYWEHIKETA